MATPPIPIRTPLFDGSGDPKGPQLVTQLGNTSSLFFRILVRRSSRCVMGIEARCVVTKVLTIGNAPLNVATGGIAADSNPVWARSFSAQMVHGGTSLGYWLQALNGRVPAKTNAGDLVEELYQASAPSPGGIAWYTPDTSREGDQDVNTYWIDGDHAGDKVAITYDLVV